MRLFLFLAFVIIFTSSASAQLNNIYQSQNFRLGEAHYRVAEPTQIADTVLVWGDVVLPGTYLVPRGISLAQMLAYARGPINLRTQETDLDWSQVFVEISITNRDTGESLQLIQKLMVQLILNSSKKEWKTLIQSSFGSGENQIS
jgi:hypothetical protein